MKSYRKGKPTPSGPSGRPQDESSASFARVRPVEAQRRLDQLSARLSAERQAAHEQEVRQRRIQQSRLEGQIAHSEAECSRLEQERSELNLRFEAAEIETSEFPEPGSWIASSGRKLLCLTLEGMIGFIGWVLFNEADVRLRVLAALTMVAIADRAARWLIHRDEFGRLQLRLAGLLCTFFLVLPAFAQRYLFFAHVGPASLRTPPLPLELAAILLGFSLAAVIACALIYVADDDQREARRVFRKHASSRTRLWMVDWQLRRARTRMEKRQLELRAVRAYLEHFERVRDLRISAMFSRTNEVKERYSTRPIEAQNEGDHPSPAGKHPRVLGVPPSLRSRRGRAYRRDPGSQS